MQPAALEEWRIWFVESGVASWPPGLFWMAPLVVFLGAWAVKTVLSAAGRAIRRAGTGAWRLVAPRRDPLVAAILHALEHGAVVWDDKRNDLIAGGVHVFGSLSRATCKIARLEAGGVDCLADLTEVERASIERAARRAIVRHEARAREQRRAAALASLRANPIASLWPDHVLECLNRGHAAKETSR